jgi:hypothetical protein
MKLLLTELLRRLVLRKLKPKPNYTLKTLKTSAHMF